MPNIRIYVAAPWIDKELALVAKRTLESNGFVVTSRWIEQHLEKPAGQSGLDTDPEILKREAIHDVEDVYSCDLMILLNTQKRGEETSGKAVETGLALAWLKPVILVGARTNVFHWLDMPIVATVEDAIAIIRDWEAKRSRIIQV